MVVSPALVNHIGSAINTIFWVPNPWQSEKERIQKPFGFIHTASQLLEWMRFSRFYMG